MTATLPPVSEREFLRQVSEVARLYQWRAYHLWLSSHSERGWPDVGLRRPPRLILAELKRENGKTTPHQARWLALVGACPGVETHLWRPSDLDAIARCLGA